MNAASREALAAGSEQLERAVADVDTATLARVADEMLAVARLLVREARLRRALSDPSRSDRDRQQLAEGVFGDHVGSATMTVLSGVAAARWSEPTDLVDGCELLGVQALLIAAERAGELAEVEDELFRFGRVIENNPTLGAVLGDDSAPAERREALVAELLEGKARAVTVRLAQLAVIGIGGRGFEASLDRLVELAAGRRDRSVAHVRVAAPIDARRQRELAESLAHAYGRQMSLQVEVDESLLGGAVVRIGEDLYDGSVARRLADARHALAH